MGALSLIVYCNCGEPPDLPGRDWGRRQSEERFLDDDQVERLREWWRQLPEAPCPHPEKLVFAYRSTRPMVSALRWAMDGRSALSPEDRRVLDLLRFPSGGWDGDCLVLSPADARELLREISLLPLPTGEVECGGDPDLGFFSENPSQLWRHALRLSIAQRRPLLIGYGI